MIREEELEERLTQLDQKISREELEERLAALRTMFDIVRLVEVSGTREISFEKNGRRYESEMSCFCVWKKEERCMNCISAKAYSQKGRISKFEFIGNDIYFVVAQYVEVDGEPYVLELVHQLADDTLVEAYGKGEFVDRITSFNDSVYLDSLTRVRNRRYYDEQLSGLICEAVVMIDVDRFKGINDRFGHAAGDHALEEVAAILRDSAGKKGMAVRYGGDEFAVCFPEISREELAEILEGIREAAESFRSERYPELKLSLSIGAALGREAASQMLLLADEALYRSKESRNCVTLTG